MVETQQMYEEMADALLQRAKTIRAGYKYSEDEKMAQCAGIVGQNGPESAMIPLHWRDDRQKHAMMTALGMTAKATNARAVFLIADVRWVLSTTFCEHFKIPEPGFDDAGFKEYQNRYTEIMQRYDGQIKNLPRKLWTEGVMVALKGPGIKPIMRIASYVEGRRDSIEWLAKPPIEGDDLRTHINMLPDWWTVQ